MPTCPRCPGTALRRDRDAGDLTFLSCADCGRRFTLDGGALTERWGGAVSLALYGVLFTDRPQDEDIRWRADQLARLDTVAMAAEIRLELAEPSQPVAAVLPGMRAGEDDLRAYLRLLADELEQRTVKGPS